MCLGDLGNRFTLSDEDESQDDESRNEVPLRDDGYHQTELHQTTSQIPNRQHGISDVVSMLQQQQGLLNNMIIGQKKIQENHTKLDERLSKLEKQLKEQDTHTAQ